MNSTIEISTKFDFDKKLVKASENLAYYKEDLLLNIATRIIDTLESQNMNRVQLAKKMNVTPAYITKILRGHTNLSIESLAKVAFALDLKWECKLIPQNKKIGIYKLQDDFVSKKRIQVETEFIEPCSHYGNKAKMIKNKVAQELLPV